MAGVRRAASGPVVSQALARGVTVSAPGRPLGRRRPCRGAPRTWTGSKKMYAPLTTPSLAVSRSNKASESGTPGRRTPPGRTRRLPPPPVVLSSAVQGGGGGTETRWNGRTGAREQGRTLSRAASLPSPGHARCCSHHLADASFGAPVEFDAHALAEGAAQRRRTALWRPSPAAWTPHATCPPACASSCWAWGSSQTGRGCETHPRRVPQATQGRHIQPRSQP